MTKTLLLTGTVGPVMRELHMRISRWLIENEGKKAYPELLVITRQYGGLMLITDSVELVDFLSNSFWIDPSLAEGRCMAVDNKPTPHWQRRPEMARRKDVSPVTAEDARGDEHEDR